MEEQVELICSLRWPSRRQAGTFQKTIGRSTETAAMYQMPGFPVSLLRDADAFRDFCEPHLTKLRTKVYESWEFWFNVECDNAIARQALPPAILPVTFGPFPANQLGNATDELKQAADMQWTQLQTYETASVQVFKSGIGMTSDALHDLYRWLWGTKDTSIRDFEIVDTRLREDYTRLARSRLREGNETIAAQYAKIAFDLSSTENAAEELKLEFIDLVEHWNRISATKENAVKRVATIAREGNAEWWNLVTDRYYRNGLISPITNEVNKFYSSGGMETHRQELRSLSASNPYRRGLELMEKTETDLGFWATMHAGILTEWPLEELRRRVPASIIEQMRRGSLWSPDTRLEKLSEFSPAELRQCPFSGGIMPYLHSIHALLDGNLPGILIHALDQLPET